jgi:hypothetical protein
LRVDDPRAQLVLALKDPSNPDTTERAFVVDTAATGFQVSGLSSRYAVGLTGRGPDGPGFRYFIYRMAASGLGGDITLPLGAPVRPLAQSAALPPGAANARLTILTGAAFKFGVGSGVAFLVGSAASGELNRTLYLQSTIAPDVPMLMIQNSNLTGYDSSFHETDSLSGAYLKHTGGDDLVVDGSAFFDLIDPSHEPDAVLDSNTTVRCRHGSVLLPLRFSNSSLAIRASSRSGKGAWTSQTVSSAGITSSSLPTLTLYRDGVLTGIHVFDELRWGINSAAGAHQLHSTHPYRIGYASGRRQPSFRSTRARPIGIRHR